jgi:hypothetical protein
MKAIAQVTSPMFLLPAYGRKYASRQDAVKAWQAGKDFQIYNGPYCSIRDIDTMRTMASSVFIQYESGTVEV